MPTIYFSSLVVLIVSDCLLIASADSNSDRQGSVYIDEVLPFRDFLTKSFPSTRRQDYVDEDYLSSSATDTDDHQASGGEGNVITIEPISFNSFIRGFSSDFNLVNDVIKKSDSDGDQNGGADFSQLFPDRMKMMGADYQGEGGDDGDEENGGSDLVNDHSEHFISEYNVQDVVATEFPFVSQVTDSVSHEPSEQQRGPVRNVPQNFDYDHHQHHQEANAANDSQLIHFQEESWPGEENSYNQQNQDGAADGLALDSGGAEPGPGTNQEDYVIDDWTAAMGQPSHFDSQRLKALGDTKGDNETAGGPVSGDHLNQGPNQSDVNYYEQVEGGEEEEEEVKSFMESPNILFTADEVPYYEIRDDDGSGPQPDGPEPKPGLSGRGQQQPSGDLEAVGGQQQQEEDEGHQAVVVPAQWDLDTSSTPGLSWDSAGQHMPEAQETLPQARLNVQFNYTEQQPPPPPVVFQYQGLPVPTQSPVTKEPPPDFLRLLPVAKSGEKPQRSVLPAYDDSAGPPPEVSQDDHLKSHHYRPVTKESEPPPPAKVQELPRSGPELFGKLFHRNKDHYDEDYGGGGGGDEGTYYPHQYNVEIRKRLKFMPLKGPVAWLEEPDKENTTVHEGNERHLDKELELTKYRLLEHKEEEHWHEKKWLKGGVAERYVDGQPVAVHLARGPPPPPPDSRQESQAKEETQMPYYARPIEPDASHHEIHEHFVIPSPGFRVNRQFESWVHRPLAHW